MPITMTAAQLGAFVWWGSFNPLSEEGIEALLTYLDANPHWIPSEVNDLTVWLASWNESGEPMDTAEGEGWECDEDADEDENERAALAWLKARTHVIEYDNGILYRDL